MKQWVWEKTLTGCCVGKRKQGTRKRAGDTTNTKRRAPARQAAARSAARIRPCDFYNTGREQQARFWKKRGNYKKIAMGEQVKGQQAAENAAMAKRAESDAAEHTAMKLAVHQKALIAKRAESDAAAVAAMKRALHEKAAMAMRAESDAAAVAAMKHVEQELVGEGRDLQHRDA